jgi:aminoglycoside 3-N-acetyltransferase
VYSVDTNEISQDAMGIIPATVLAQPGRVRGNHPLCSFTAIGPEAKLIVSSQTPIDIFAPLRALAEAGGWVVLMGVGLCSMTLVHAAEELAGRRPFIRWANGPDGKPMSVTMGGCSDGFEEFEPVLSPLARTCQVGQSLWRAFPATETLSTTSKAIRENPEITRCANPECGRCGDQILGGPIGFEELANEALQRTPTSGAAELQ